MRLRLQEIKKKRSQLSIAARAIAEKADCEARTLLNQVEEKPLNEIFGEYCNLLSQEKALRSRRSSPSE